VVAVGRPMDGGPGGDADDAGERGRARAWSCRRSSELD